MVRRTFFEVGNGLFALEETEGIVSVYDCGANSTKKIDFAVNSAAMMLGNTIAGIDNLFISHYHKDHMNGVLRLLLLFPVKRVFLPMVPDLVRIQHVNVARINQIDMFFIDPVGTIHTISPDTNVIFVGGTEEANEEYVEIANLGDNTVLWGSSVRGVEDDWLYLLYNPRIMSIPQNYQIMHTLGINPKATAQDIVRELSRMVRGRQNTVAKIIGRALGVNTTQMLNDYSMVLWSGRRSDYSNGCFYTGDFNAKNPNIGWQELEVALGPLHQNSEIIQIPHHGSEYNFDMAMCVQNASHVISASNPPYKSRQRVDPRKVIGLIQGRGYKEQDTLAGAVIV